MVSIERSLPAQHQTERRLTETGSIALSAAPGPRPEPARNRTRDQVRPSLHVINAELFRGALIRERRTADRSNQQFGVLLVGIAERSATAASVWDAAIEAVGSAKRDMDVFGWFEHGATLGIILPDIGGTDAPHAKDIEATVGRELQKRLGPTVAARFSIKLHVHRDRREEGTDALRTVEPIIATLRPARQLAFYDTLKRVFDLIASLVLLTLLSPLFLIIAALVKLTSRGPVYFRQQRVGQDAKPFTMLKFRSMQSDSNEAVHQSYVTWFIQSSDAAALSQSRAQKPDLFKIANDPRVTAIGRLLRRTSLDELPQLWNVVRGEMSLVGPRPPLPYEVEQYKAWHCRRVLEAKPGITGLWQVAGRSRTTFDEMVRLDLRYAKRCSFWTDLKILLATPRAVISGKGAC